MRSKLSPALSLVIGAPLLFAGAGVQAQEAAERFTLTQTEGGVMRLDKDNGSVSFCVDRSGQLVCEPSVDAIIAYEAEIEALEAENQALRTQLSEIASQLEGLATAARESAQSQPETAKVDEGKGKSWIGPEEEQQLEEALDFAGDAMRRLFNMVDDLKSDFNGTAEDGTQETEKPAQ